MADIIVTVEGGLAGSPGLSNVYTETKQLTTGGTTVNPTVTTQTDKINAVSTPQGVVFGSIG